MRKMLGLSGALLVGALLTVLPANAAVIYNTGGADATELGCGLSGGCGGYDRLQLVAQPDATVTGPGPMT